MITVWKNTKSFNDNKQPVALDGRIPLFLDYMVNELELKVDFWWENQSGEIKSNLFVIYSFDLQTLQNFQDVSMLTCAISRTRFRRGRGYFDAESYLNNSTPRI